MLLDVKIKMWIAVCLRKKTSICISIDIRLLALCRGHKPSRGGSADVPADPDDDPASSGHEALPAVPHGDAPPSSAQHEPLPQLQHGGCDTKKDDAFSAGTQGNASLPLEKKQQQNHKQRRAHCLGFSELLPHRVRKPDIPQKLLCRR